MPIDGCGADTELASYFNLGQSFKPGDGTALRFSPPPYLVLLSGCSTAQALFEQIKADGYDGAYSQLSALFARGAVSKEVLASRCAVGVRAGQGLSVRLE